MGVAELDTAERLSAHLRSVSFIQWQRMEKQGLGS